MKLITLISTNPGLAYFAERNPSENRVILNLANYNGRTKATNK